MRSQQKEWVNRDVAQNPIEHKDNQNRISNPCPQGKPRFPEQNADQTVAERNRFVPDLYGFLKMKIVFSEFVCFHIVFPIEK